MEKINADIRQIQDLARGCSKMARKHYAADNHAMGDHFIQKELELETKAANMRLEQWGIK